MFHSSRRDRKAKVFAEVLAMIADAHPEPNWAHHAHDTDERLWESATEFCSALDRYAVRAAQIKKKNH